MKHMTTTIYAYKEVLPIMTEKSHCSPFMMKSASRSSLVQFISPNTFLSNTSKTTSTKTLQCKSVSSTEKCLSPDSNPEYLIKSTGSCSMLLSVPALPLNFIKGNIVLQKENTVQLDKRGLLRLATEYNSGNANLRMHVIVVEDIYDKSFKAKKC